MYKFHGFRKKNTYFEGWYFKLQQDQTTIAFIPGININQRGEKSAFIQIITKDSSYHVDYPIEEFSFVEEKQEIRIGKNLFSRRGIIINMKQDSLNIKGKIRFGRFTPIQYNIMGPYSLVPFMECNHGVISLYHKLSGHLNFQSEFLSFEQGIGYIEMDWGKSFPSSYLWTQSNYFKRRQCCIMASVAEIPFLGFRFKGCIGIVYFKGVEYRFATYLGVKILLCNRKQLHLKQGRYELKVSVLKQNPQKLFAPSLGHMSTVIHESATCTARYRFYIDQVLIFDYKNDRASFEFFVGRTIL